MLDEYTKAANVLSCLSNVVVAQCRDCGFYYESITADVLYMGVVERLKGLDLALYSICTKYRLVFSGEMKGRDHRVFNVCLPKMNFKLLCIV